MSNILLYLLICTNFIFKYRELVLQNPRPYEIVIMYTVNKGCD